MEDNQGWICIHTAKSLPEAHLLRALLESRGIPVNIYYAVCTKHHDYLHDPLENVRIFIPESFAATGKRYMETFLHLHDLQIKYTP